MELDDLLQPMTASEFFQDYWEAKPLHIQRNDPAIFSSFFSVREMDRFLGFLSESARVKLVKSDADKEERSDGFYKAGLHNLSEIYHSFNNGHSIVVDSLHTIREPVSRLCANITLATGIPTQVNMYITPPGATGFNCHWDDHDVMILQIEGDKTWSLFDFGPELPRPHVLKEGQEKLEPGEPSQRIVMRPGDVLYLPRGRFHQATAQEDISIHLTMGFLVHTWEHLMVAAIQALSKKRPELRKCLAPGWFSNPASVLERAREFSGLEDQLLEPDNLKEAMATLNDALVKTMWPLPDDHFSLTRTIPGIGLDTCLEHRLGPLTSLRRHQEKLLLRFPGGCHIEPSTHGKALEFARRKTRFTPREIPGDHDDEQKLALARALLSKGFLKISNR